MKLLLDENISDRIVARILDLYPGAAHARTLGLVTDTAIWDYAKQNGFILVSKDTDFEKRILALGPPPKLIFLRLGNASTATIVEVLREKAVQLQEFDMDPNSSLLIVE